MTTHYGMIGCGMMGQEHIKNINLLPDTAVTAIFEPDAGMAAIARDLAPGAIFVDSLDALVRFTGLDALVITSPNFCHAEQLEQIAAAVSLPILCEKPLYTDAADTARIARLRDTYGAPIWVAMEYRYMPPIAALIKQAALETGGIKMLTIREHRFPFLEKVGDWNRFNSKTGGTLVEKCCHFFDLMRLIVQSDPVRVMASGGQDVNHLDETYDGHTPDILDNAYVIVDFANGARAMLELSMFAEGSEYQEVVHAVGPHGKIESYVPGPTRFWSQERGLPPTPHLLISPRTGEPPRRVEIPVDPQLLEAGDHNGSTFYQHERFLQVVRGRGEVEVTLEDGAWAVAIGMAAQQSLSTHEAVKISPPLR
ncbi:Gfo/Idh/MocA family protein [Sulfitobacter sp. S190]|uniref:Gfo/Idh/MocA family protein n=1 Tax=Sulfitobacter sp. S190 TaxID=2867022 RepID=UPI0021A5E6B1|nr:Gfo/Idh/MocA family oxidoreductase [Sulfitobacter sp. S190]UWR21883.1 Gfo/Idh/MocA family oxidoreductase [Sulfitobacter sp. S190]